MSDLATEDFEKIDRFQEQDENVTSTSMTGDMAEEDRYGDTAEIEAEEMLNDFKTDFRHDPSGGEPLITFGSPETTVKESPAMEDSVSGKVETCSTEGCFMKNVDPRVDEVVKGLNIEETMEGEDVVAPPELPARTESCDPSAGDSAATSVPSKVQDLNDYDNESDSLESSSEDSYSSSDADSEAESSSSEKSDDDLGLNLKHQNKVLASAEENVLSKEFCESDITGKMDTGKDLKTSEEGTAECMDTLKDEDLQDDIKPEVLEEVSSGMLFSAVATAELSDEGQEHDTTSGIGGEFRSEKVDEMVETEEHNESEPTVMLGDMSGVRVTGLSAEDMSDILDKLTKDEDFENISPVVSNIVGDAPVVREVQEKISSEDSDADTESSDEDVSLDSDISDDDLANADWSPSPLHTGGYSFVQDDGSDESDENEEMEEGTDDQEDAVLQGYEYKAEQEDITDPGKADKLRQDVHDLMAEVDTLAQTDPSLPVAVKAHIAFKGEAIPLKVPVLVEEELAADDVEAETVEIVNQSEETSQLIAAISKEAHAHDLLHVTFQSPTNTIFYDPESPVIERVSIEESNELIDEEESKDNEKASHPSDDSQKDDSHAKLEAEVAQDLKEVYDNLEARAEIEGALELLKESGLKNVEELAHQMAADVLRRNKASAKPAGPDETGDTTVVFRKNKQNVTDESGEDESEVNDDRGSMIVHDVPEACQQVSSQHDEDIILRVKEESGGAANREAVSSMVIYDVENENLDAVCLSEEDEAAVENTSVNVVEETPDIAEVVQKVELAKESTENDESTQDIISLTSEEEDHFNTSMNDTVIEVKYEDSVEKKADQMVQELLTEVLHSNAILVETSNDKVETELTEKVSNEGDEKIAASEQNYAIMDNITITKDSASISNSEVYETEQILEPHSNKQVEEATVVETLSTDIQMDDKKVDEQTTVLQEHTKLFNENNEEKNLDFVKSREPVGADDAQYLLSKLPEDGKNIEENITMSQNKLSETEIRPEVDTRSVEIGAPDVYKAEICSKVDTFPVEMAVPEVYETIIGKDVATSPVEMGKPADSEAIVDTSPVEEGTLDDSEAVVDTRPVEVGTLDDSEAVVDTSHVEVGTLDDSEAVVDTSPIVTGVPEASEAVISPDVETSPVEVATPDVSKVVESPVQEEDSVSMLEPQAEKMAEETATCPSSASVSEMVHQVIQEVLEIIYWRDVKKTGVMFGCMLFILLSLACFSLLSVVAYLSLAVLTVTFSFRVYKTVMQAVQKTNEGHPFKNLMELDLELKEDVVKNAAEKIAGNINNCSQELRRLYLVGDYIDSLKFGLLLWLLTYVGSWFNGMTLVILGVISIFTLPKVYETYQGPIDQNINLVRAQLNKIMAQVSEKIPFPKKKAKAQ